MPEKVEVYISSNGKKYTLLGTVENPVDEKEEGNLTHDFVLEAPDTQARFVKIVAVNRGTCPDWHPGSGHKAWIFADEIQIE